MGANNFYSIRVNAINPNNQTHLQKNKHKNEVRVELEKIPQICYK
jgi:hypothetical protein